MIYLISDIHGDKDFKGLKEYAANAGEEDLLIILGDVGLEFEKTERNREFTQFFLGLQKPIAIVDGNHENFAFLNSFPEEEWNGGRIHRLSPYIAHLMRGNIYCLEGKTFFVFGGCKSSAKWAEMGLWYPGEEASQEECELARANLKAHGNQVDYILTHKYESDPPAGTVSVNLQKLTAEIEQMVSYRTWYAGHWHMRKIVDDRHELVYEELVAIT